jgi:hypothetical protein
MLMSNGSTSYKSESDPETVNASVTSALPKDGAALSHKIEN